MNQSKSSEKQTRRILRTVGISLIGVLFVSVGVVILLMSLHAPRNTESSPSATNSSSAPSSTKTSPPPTISAGKAPVIDDSDNVTCKNNPDKKGSRIEFVTVDASGTPTKHEVQC